MKKLLLILPFFFLLSPLAHASLTTNIQAYYKLDETSGNASDATGNGWTMTNHGSAVYGAGFINNAVTTNQTNSQYLSNASVLGTTVGGAITLSCWIKPVTPANNTEGNFITISGNGTSPYVQYTMAYQQISGVISLVFNRGKSCIANQQFLYTTTLPTTSWTYVAYTYDGTTGTGYVNGTSVASLAQSGNGSSCGSSESDIGSDGGTTQIFNGSIDECGVWNRALSSTEITSLYNSGTGCQYPFSALSSPQCLAVAVAPSPILSFFTWGGW